MKYVKIEGGVKLSTFISPMSASLSDAPAFDDPPHKFNYCDGMPFRKVSLIPSIISLAGIAA
jgi:hypothetical protein